MYGSSPQRVRSPEEKRLVNGTAGGWFRVSLLAHMDRHRNLLDVGLPADGNRRAEALPSNVRKVVVGEEELEDPESPNVKEEPEELWSSQDAGIPKSTFTPVPVKTEDDDEEKPQCSQLRQTEHMKSEADGEDCGGPEPARISDNSETEVSEGDWEETSELRKNPEITLGDLNCNAIERSYSCPECGQRFGRKPHLSAHMRIHTGEKPFSCSFCGKRFSQKGNSISHMRLHTGEKPFSCSVCKKQFRYSGDVSRHMRIHIGKKKCKSGVTESEPAESFDPVGLSQPDPPENPSEAETQTSMDDWRESREPESGFNFLKDNEGPVNDTRCITGKETFRCSECRRTFCRRDHLMSHMRTHTGEKPFSCSVCQKRFSCSGNILAHMRIHTGEKPFECSFCGKSFSQKGTLQLHVRIHTGEKPFSCPFCDKRFAHKRRMTLHMSVHTEEKRFSCSACDRRFTWYTQLRTHKCVAEASKLRTSQSEKKVPIKESFSCTVCNKNFSLKGNLKTHMRIHTGEKPFSCSVCGKSFKQNVHLTEHMTIHTGEKLYKCRVCGKGFNKKLLIKNHKCV